MPSPTIINRSNNWPTCRCLVCERLKNPKASIVNLDTAWLCDKCRAALLKVVESEGEK